MAESYNAGGIYYDVSIDVDQALKANDVMQKSSKHWTQAKELLAESILSKPK